MKTIILEQPGVLRLAETDPPGQPGPGEALVRVRRVGICGTDLHAFAGQQNFFSYPRILGHELAVEVAVIGPTEQTLDIAVGDTCCVIPYLHCGQCIACRRGKTNCCVKMQVLGVHRDGGMQEWIIVPVDKLLKAEAIPPEHLALVEMLCIGAHAVKRAQLEAGETALVIGAGPIGLAVCQFALLSGVKVIVLDISDKRLEFCRRHFAVEAVIDGKDDPLTQIHVHLKGEFPTAVFDATGSSKSMNQAFGYVAHGGSLTFVGHFPGDVTFHDSDFHQREMTLLASRNATYDDFAWSIQMLQQGQINLIPWITQQVSPEEIITAFPTWLDPAQGMIKTMLEF
ncbi:MAG: zinc-binding alcohol dehydrogenase family protein [Anaerolineae bacterium]|nr:zinc-binding alcohol dehydrogenase family protein [Anaerolineae bacterium]